MIAIFTTEVYRSKTVKRRVAIVVKSDESHHLLVGAVGLEADLLSDPFCTFAGDSLLGKFVAELYFKFRTIKCAFSVQTGDIEFPLLFWCFLCRESRRSEYESQFLDILQRISQLVIGIDGEAVGSDWQTATGSDLLHQIIAQCLVYVVYQLHFHVSPPPSLQQEINSKKGMGLVCSTQCLLFSSFWVANIRKFFNTNAFQNKVQSINKRKSIDWQRYFIIECSKNQMFWHWIFVFEKYVSHKI